MCNLSQVATGARFLRSVDRVLPKSNMCSIWGATETSSQQRADEANSNERGGGQRTSNNWRGEVNAAKWKLGWKPQIRVFKRAQWQKKKKRVKIFQIVQHNSYINSCQIIAKKSVNSTGKAQLPSTGLAHFSRDQSFNKKTTLDLGIESEAQVSFIVTHGLNLIIVQLKYLH